MVSIRRKILDKGEIVQEQLIRVLQKHEDALGNAGESTAYDDTDIKADIAELKTKVAALEAANDSP